MSYEKFLSLLLMWFTILHFCLQCLRVTLVHILPSFGIVILLSLAFLVNKKWYLPCSDDQWCIFSCAYLTSGIQYFFPGGSDAKESARNAGDLGLIPGSGRSPGGGKGNPLQYCCLENSWTEESSGLQSIGSHRVRHEWSDLVVAAAHMCKYIHIYLHIYVKMFGIHFIVGCWER